MKAFFVSLVTLVFQTSANGFLVRPCVCCFITVTTSAHVGPRCKRFHMGRSPTPKKLAESFRCSLCAVLLQRAHMEYLRPKEAAKRLGISRNTLNRYLAKGLIRCSRPSLRCTLISTAELARFYSATAQPVPVSVVRAA